VFVRRRPANFLLLAVLVFQLAFGLQGPLARASADIAPGHLSASGAVAQHCAEHAADASSAQVHLQGAPDPVQGSPDSSKHDCCQTFGCQCLCSYTPMLAGLVAIGAAPLFVRLLPALDARVVTTRVSEFLRPPIA